MTGNKRTALVLQPRDLRLMEALETMRVIDRQQAKVVAGFNSTTRANARLSALARAGFLKRAFIGSRQAVYWLASKPLEGPKSQKQRRCRRTRCTLFLRHQMEINRALAGAVQRYSRCPAGGLSAGRAFKSRCQLPFP
jgi:hypothetical protein